MIRMGVVGPSDTVDKITAFADEFNDKVEFTAFKYDDKYKIIDLVKNIPENIDVLLFSGEAPYTLAYCNDAISRPSLYIDRQGTSLYKLFWQVREDNIEIKNFSSEVFSEKVYVETLEELGLVPDHIHIYGLDLSKYVDYQELADFHYNLWEKNKTTFAITGFTAIYNLLKERGMPVYKIYPTKQLIREAIEKGLLIGKASNNLKSQTAIQIIRIVIGDHVKPSSYDMQTIKNKVESMLIDYTRDNLGMLVPGNNNEYIIFTNRGAIEQRNVLFDRSKIPAELDRLGILILSGIGYGENVHSAELNARIALDHAQKKDFHCTYLMDENGKVTGPYSGGDDNLFSYELSAGKNEEIKEMSKRSGLSPVNISKIKNLMAKLNKNELDAGTVATFLGISDRSARRILSSLVDSGYGEVKHAENKAKTGRPRKIYKLKI